MYQVKVLGGFHSNGCTDYCCWVVLLCIIIWWICTGILVESAASINRIELIEMYVSCHILFFIHGAIFDSEVNVTFSSLLQLDTFSIYPHAKVNGNVLVVVRHTLPIMHECYEICAQMSTCGWLFNIKLDSVFFNIFLPYFSFFNQFSNFSQIITVILLSII
jgi:hypothetical protein